MQTIHLAPRKTAQHIITFITAAFDPRKFPISEAIPSPIPRCQNNPGHINDHNTAPFRQYYIRSPFQILSKGGGISLFIILRYPFAGIIFDIFPYFIIILLIPHHMVIIGTLEQTHAIHRCSFIVCLCYLIFVPTNNISQCRGRVSRP